MIVKELIKELKKFPPEANVFYTTGGSFSYESVKEVFDDNELHDADKGGVLIGECTW